MARAVSATVDKSAEARRWKKELQLAGKREKDWRSDSEKIVKRYRGEEKKRNRFNVLWANTQILRPAIYNSRPNPDVRRRFRDADPVGKAVSEVLERSLSVFVDGDETDDALKNDVLDGLLCGRGLSRIRYIPKISSVPSKAQPDDKEEGDEDEPEEELESETVCMEHVDWEDFRHGYGRVWAEVPSEFFRHKMTRPEALKIFAEEDIARVKFAAPVVESMRQGASEQAGETHKVAEFWETWDKLGCRVFFINEDVEHLLFPKDNEEGEPPLEFDGFFPNPRPLAIVENTSSLLPIPMFHLYEDQANQMDILSGRIDKIVKTMRLRGIYDGRITEMADILSGDDNDMVPVQNAQQWTNGGKDSIANAMAFVPVEKNAEILAALYEARDRQKAAIDELLGISDIMRGATDPDETLGAQNLKSNYGSVRLQRMQKEVQRYARDLLRLGASAMSQKFSPETFESMTELKFPTAAQKQAMVGQFQMQQQQAMMAPQPAPGGVPPIPGPQGAGAVMPPAQAAPPMNPQLLQVPTWEDILGVMRSEKMRQYRIDVETDSTIAGTLSSDMSGLSQVLKAVSDTITGLAPLVTDGALPIDAAKELVMAVIRRSRLGMAVEDAFDKMTAPKPPPDPNAGKAQAAAATAQISAQSDEKIAGMKAQSDQAIKQAHEENKAAIAQMHEQGKQQMHESKNALDAQKLQFQEEMKTQRDQMNNDHQAATELMMGKLDAMVKIITASMAATATSDAAAVAKADAEIGRDIN